MITIEKTAALRGRERGRAEPKPRKTRCLAASALIATLAACSGDVRTPPIEPSPHDEGSVDQINRERTGTLTGGGFTLFSSRSSKAEAEGGGAGGVGVNAYLWRASLETLDFIPLASADPFGGLIISEWYQPADAPGERFKLNVLIRDRSLRADGVKVSVFRQVQGESGWIDAAVDPGTATAIEDEILTRARELRIASGDG